jgi:predicted ester cyclase
MTPNRKVILIFVITRRGTHTGNFMGISPTKKSITIGGIAIFSIMNGKITELHGQFDQMGMMQQLGMISVGGE